jgi:hypothetical protein
MPSVVVESWSLSKLMAGFKVLVTQDIVPLKLCLFIDGLDEYEGDHEEMAELFKAVTSSESVKACVSSRPWNVFEECFKTCPGLRLQDLTKGDIEHYTNHKFHNSHAFKRLASQQPALSTSLVEEIVEYSSGVFLWVRGTEMESSICKDGCVNIQETSRHSTRICEDSQTRYMWRKLL